MMPGARFSYYRTPRSLVLPEGREGRADYNQLRRAAVLPILPAALLAVLRNAAVLDHRQASTLITSKWWSKVHTGASSRTLMAASTVSNRVMSWSAYRRTMSEAS
jgi:hypothetical protein